MFHFNRDGIRIFTANRDGLEYIEIGGKIAARKALDGWEVRTCKGWRAWEPIAKKIEAFERGEAPARRPSPSRPSRPSPSRRQYHPVE